MAHRRRSVRRFTRGRREFAWVGDSGEFVQLDSSVIGESGLIQPADLTGSASKRTAILRKIVGSVDVFPFIIPFAAASFAYRAGVYTADVDDQTIIDPGVSNDLTEEIWHWTFTGVVYCNAAVMTDPPHHEVNISPNRRLTTDQEVRLAIAPVGFGLTDDGELSAQWQLRMLLEFG